MNVPLTLLLIPYALLLFAFGALAVINVFHIARFGSFDSRNLGVTVIFLVYTLVIAVAAVVYLLGVDWQQTLTIPVTISGNGTP